MHIVMQSHRAALTDAQRVKYEQMVAARARKFPSAVRAVVRLSEDGARRRVEIVLDLPRQASIAVLAEGEWFATCLSQALARLDARVRKVKATPRTRARKTRAARR